MLRRLLAAAPVAVLLALPASAPAIVNGTDASAGEWPGQAWITIDTLGPGVRHCGGTLVGTRQVLTAGQCAEGLASQPDRFSVTLGELNVAPPNADVYTVTAVDVHPAFNPVTRRHDVAMLTLGRPANGYELTRVVGEDETDLWAPGTGAGILGWGDTAEGGPSSDVLQEALVPVRSDADCGAAYSEDDFFDPATMLCAGAGTLDSPDFCGSRDRGGPLLVPDGIGFWALAGVMSTRFACDQPGQPGIYARIGDPPLNPWVKTRTPEADFTLSHAPRANEPVELISTSHHPEDPGYWAERDHHWDLDNDGLYDDATGSSVDHTFTRQGRAIVGLEVAKAGGDRAVVYYAFDVGPDPTVVTPPPAGPAPAPGPPPVLTPVRTGPLATILNARRPRVRRGRFPIRIRFATAAPRGTAVVELYRGARRIGIARTRVAPGKTKRVRVRLTPTGRRLLRRDADGRMRVRVRVRVRRTVLRSKRLTIRR